MGAALLARVFVFLSIEFLGLHSTARQIIPLFSNIVMDYRRGCCLYPKPTEWTVIEQLIRSLFFFLLRPACFLLAHMHNTQLSLYQYTVQELQKADAKSSLDTYSRLGA